MLRSSLFTFGLVSLSSSLAVAQQSTLSAAASTRATTVVTLNPARGAQGVSPARIRIDYGQPHLRGRKLHTPTLVPLDSVWRFGANEATALETEVDLLIGGKPVPKGKYTLYALPAAAGWKLIVNSNTGQWGTEYDAKHDLVRVDLQKRTLPAPVESFSVWLIPSTQPGPPSGELRFAWGDAELSTNWQVPAAPAR